MHLVQQNDEEVEMMNQVQAMNLIYYSTRLCVNKEQQGKNEERWRMESDRKWQKDAESWQREDKIKEKW